jgi:hypothetical protein
MTMPKFDPMKSSYGFPPMISEAGERMARRTASRNWRETKIDVSDAQAEFEESPESEMANDPQMRYDYDNFLEQAQAEQEHMAGRSFGRERSRLRS